MSFTDPIDTTHYDFEAWMRFAFDHPHREGSPWYFDEDMHFECNPETVITYYTRLFHDPRRLLSPFDEGQIEQGLWFAVGHQLSDWIWDDDIPIRLRLDCIDAMPSMFRDFLVDRPLDTSCFMWWDMLRFFGDEPDPQIVEHMFQALGRVLALPSHHCQLSALHGLGHLQHEATEGLIRRFLAANPDADEEIRDYAEHAIAGNVL